MRLIPRVFILAFIFLLFISYQNFSPVNPNEWDGTSSLKIINEMKAFQEHDKQSEVLAAPQNGSDLQSISNDWMQRQGSLILNGYDKKLEAAMNEKLNSWIREITKKESAEENTAEKSSSTPENESEKTVTENSESPKPQPSLRFSRVNSLKYDISQNTCMNLTAEPSNTRLNLSQNLTQNAKVGVEHKTANSQTQFFLNYEW